MKKVEDSLNRNYVNISDRPFSHCVYNDKDRPIFSYKPTGGFWLSLESSEKGYYSEWDSEYRETMITDSDGNLHATVVRFKPTTYIMSPAGDKTLLEGFYKFVSGKNLSPDQKRKLLVELVAKHENKPDIKNIICQIDLLEDLMALEEIFGGYKIGNKYPNEVYENLAANVKKGIRESFSGLEVTGYALGLDKSLPSEAINQTQMYWSSLDPDYKETIEYFDLHSVAVFDTSCLDVVKQIVYPQETKEKDGEDREE